ncbi:hypothetical protein [Mesorhizobium sp. LNJC384A00]|uniref:helix-turn-helix transcriptional regulator n=1 Tax=Mesorhizobium sp. LNJC384A00 TaxID=1287268 RepID=UPI0005186D95|nr:hypothetical protein [Mesorhizobium sp. LNJC384A00]
MTIELAKNSYVRLREIIGPDGLLPISRSNWYAKIKDGRAPAPVKFGRLSLWDRHCLNKFLEDPNGYGSKTAGVE